jgi:type IV secretory pathway TraG/TraD family ATPase VirD4
MIIGTANQESGSYDPYWEDAATNVLAAEIHLIMQNARVQGKDPRIADVVRLNRNMKVMPMSDTLKINLTRFFDEAEKRFGDSRAKMLWSTVQNNAPRTTDCVLSFLNTGMNRTFSGNVLKMSKKKQQLDIAKIGQEKTALFITTSPVNNTCSDVVNIMYGDIIRELFTEAEHEPGHRLKVPVHMICDDFACGGKIKDFEKYISIFRATGMSATILLQSESQLVNIYGSTNATTIINNCDTYVYMGGTDLPTCENISRRIDRPIERVLNMDLGRVIVFRRGSKPIIARRYQTLDDEIYKSLGKETEL